MGHQPSVLTTIGPDPGLTREERVVRAQQKRWRGVIAGSRQLLGRVEAKLQIASKPQQASLEAKAEMLREQIAHAEAKLEDLKLAGARPVN